VLHRDASSAVAILWFKPQKTQFTSGFMDRTVIYITHLRFYDLRAVKGHLSEMCKFIYKIT